MANPLRNEVEIELNGKPCVMRATFTAICAIEKALGKSAVALVFQLQRGDLSITEAATIVFHGLRGNDDTRMTFEEVGEAIVAKGFGVEIFTPIADFIACFLNGVSVGKPDAEKTAA